MHIENAEALRVWLESCLAKISNAEPAALAKYVIALVKKDKDEKELYSFLLEQLDIFLHENTKFFVDMLFAALSSKCYTKTNLDDEKRDLHSQASQAVEVSLRNPPNDMVLPPGVDLKNDRVDEAVVEKEKSNPTKSLAHEKRRRDRYSHDSNRSKRLKYEGKVEVSTEKISKRCKDYDEQGYCLKGQACLYDHGSDPVVVEDCSLLNFNVNAGMMYGDPVHSQPPPLLPPVPPPPLPPLPSAPLPPLPPLPTPPAYVPETYNPESPSMNPLVNNYSSTYYSQTGVPTHSMMHSKLNSKPNIVRELIGIPIEDNLESKRRERQNIEIDRENYPKTFKNYETEKTVSKSPLYSRLGPYPKRNSYEDPRGSTLLLKKVPKELNTIEAINRHFSSFGTVKNIECNYEGDPGAALVKFQNSSEAATAYRSTEAIMNNRFIRVFYHRNFNKTDLEPIKTIEKEPIKSVDNQNQSEKIVEAPPALVEKIPLNKEEDKKIETKTVNYSTRGSLVRTVFNPTAFALKKKVVKTKKEEKKDALQKRLMLHRKVQKLLESELEHQKLILARLNACKNAKEKELLKKMLEDLSKKISNLSSDSKKIAEELKELLNTKAKTKNDFKETEKALLDAEIELYKQENSLDANNTSLLLAKVNELKQQAKALGLIKPSRPKFPSSFVLHKRLDNQVCTLVVTPSSTVKEQDLKRHFLQYGGIQKIECKDDSFTVCFDSRKAAELALLKGKQLGSIALNLSWPDKQIVSETTNDTNADEGKDDNFPFAEEDDEEEDGESRSWRR